MPAATSTATATQTPTGTSTLTPTPTATAGPICGNTIIEDGEMCDDGNAEDRDGCTTQCVNGVMCDAITFPGGAAFVTNPSTGTCYTRYAGAMTFADARTSCESIGGSLATITGAQEQSLVQSIHQGTPWIGANDINAEGTFEWVTGEPFSFTSFAPGEPDDDTGIGGNGDCLALIDAQAGWGDTNCNFTGFVDGRICEMQVNVLRR